MQLGELKGAMQCIKAESVASTDRHKGKASDTTTSILFHLVRSRAAFARVRIA